MGLFLQTAANAGIISIFYALIAVGLALIFGVMGILNFAHGALYMVGAYAVWNIYAQVGAPFPIAIIASIAIVCGLALGMERGLFRLVQYRPMTGLLLSMGMVFILQVLMVQLWGVSLLRYVPPSIRGTLEIFGASVPWQRVIVIPAALGLLGGLWFFLHRAKMGLALRAVAQNREAAALQGIDVYRMNALAMGIGGALAGAAGGFMAPILPVTPYMGNSAVITAFIVLIVGGVGSIEGALLASLILGFLLTFVTTYINGTIATIAGAVLMFLVLVIRPRGIMGRAQT